MFERDEETLLQMKAFNDKELKADETPEKNRAKWLAKIEEWKALLASATPLPWTACGAFRNGCVCGLIWSKTADIPLMSREEPNDETCVPDDEHAKANAMLVAQAVNALPRFIEMLEKQFADKE